MAVSQQEIADAVGLSRTTVTKILNRDPKYSASDETRDLVFNTAEKMGYDFTSIRRPFKREYGRTNINAKCQIEIVTLEDNQVFDQGEALAHNIGVGGALLTHLHLPRNCLPLSRFVIRCHFRDTPILSELTGECQVVRIADSEEAGSPELGVKFINTTVDDRKVLKDYVDACIAEKQAKKLAAAAEPTLASASAPSPAPAP